MGHDKPYDDGYNPLVRPAFRFHAIQGISAGSELIRCCSEFEQWVNWCRCYECSEDDHCEKREDGCYR